MKINSLNPVINGLLLWTFFISSCNSPAPPVLSDPDKKYIEDLFLTAQNAWNQKNREEYIFRYAPDAIFMVPNMEPLVGKDAIRTFINSFPEVKVNFSVKEIMGSADYAYVEGRYALTNPADSLMDKGKFLNVLIKLRDGQWQVTRDIFNSDLPVPLSKE